jgi:hypothetical protein
MSSLSCRRWFALVALLSGVALLGSPVRAAAPQADPPQPQMVELLAGVESGQIEARLIARDSTQCRLLVTNKTDRPLSVALPEAFAAVPVLAQLAPQLQPQPQRQPQPLGIPGPRQPWANPWQNPGGPAGPWNVQNGPLWNIAPEKVASVRLPTVCLEYGRPDPRPKIDYAVKPLRQVTQKQGIAEVCAMLGRGEIRQRTAQLAAWHLSNDMSWGRLAGLRRRASIGSLPLYSRSDIAAAKRAVEKALEAAGKQDKGEMPETSQSASIDRR